MITLQLDIPTIQALAQLKVAGMKEHLDNYSTATHRWRSNIDHIARILRFLTKEYPSFSTDEKFVNKCIWVVDYSAALLTEQQKQYIWDSLSPAFLSQFIELQKRFEHLQLYTFDVSYYHEYLKKSSLELDALMEAFDATH